MCLLVFSLRRHADFPLVFAGNRDEFRGRPAESAHFWRKQPDLLAGRDLEAGGTWLGVTRGGRFATVTNYREPGERRPDARSRGDLVVDFLTGSDAPESYLTELQDRADDYNGFNLILGTPDDLYYFSNRGAREHGSNGGTWENGVVVDADRSGGTAEHVSGGESTVGSPGRIHKLEAGVYGLSNEQLDTPWPKVRRAKSLFHKVIGEHGPTPEPLLEMLADRERAQDGELPSTGLTQEWERALSSIFISGKEYGTRASTVVLWHRDGGVTFVERSFGPEGRVLGTERYHFSVVTTDVLKR